MITDVRDTPPEDETSVRAQPALTSSSGAIWLIVGALLATTGVAVLALMSGLSTPWIAIIGIALVVLLYAAMIVVHVAVPRGRARLVTLAWLMGAMAVVTLLAVAVITAYEWDLVGLA